MILLRLVKQYKDHSFFFSNCPTEGKPRYRLPRTSTTEKSTSRRSHRARKRVEKMKRNYGVSTDENYQVLTVKFIINRNLQVCQTSVF